MSKKTTSKKSVPRPAPAPADKLQPATAPAEKRGGLPPGPLREFLGRGAATQAAVDKLSKPDAKNPVDKNASWQAAAEIWIHQTLADFRAVIDHERKEADRRFDDLEAWRERVAPIVALVAKEQRTAAGSADGIADAIGVRLTPLVTAITELMSVANTPTMPPRFFHRDEGDSGDTVTFTEGAPIAPELAWQGGYLAGIKAALDVVNEEVERLNA